MTEATDLAAQDNTDAGEGNDQSPAADENVAANATDAPEVEAEAGSDAPAEGDESTEASDDANAPEGAPESYADFEMPEGMDVDTAALETAAPIFRELNLSQEQAQRLVTLQAENVLRQHNDQVEAWEADAREQYGDELKTVLADAQSGVKRFDPEGKFMAYMEQSGLGSHPDVLSFLQRVGKATSEDSFDGGGTNVTPDPVPLEDKLYGNRGQ